MQIAAIQMVSSADLQQNLTTAAALLERAAAGGARLLLLPEYWPLIGMHDADKLAIAEAPGHGPIQDFLARMAHTLGVTLIGGTLPLRSDQPGKVLNSCLVFGPDGQALARYDKIHLFGFSNGEESYDEARTIAAGARVVGFDAGFGRVGLSVCYDLRFPELYRALGTCALMVVPAAFTYTTGQAHWELLLRARAVENQCYVLAAAQGGTHQNGRRTWGHSMLVDPWGKVLNVLEQGEGIVAGELDLALLGQIRNNLPALRHKKLID